MSEEQLKAFLEAVRADASLQGKLKAASDADAIVAIAKAAGFVISVDKFDELDFGLSDKELEGVAGGAKYTVNGDTHCSVCIGYACGNRL